MSEKEKYLQVRREAVFTGVALLALIAIWLAAGFGLSGLTAKIFHIPVWAVAGTVGVWVIAIVLVRVLTGLVFRDMPLDDAGEVRHD